MLEFAGTAGSFKHAVPCALHHHTQNPVPADVHQVWAVCSLCYCASGAMAGLLRVLAIQLLCNLYCDYYCLCRVSDPDN